MSRILGIELRRSTAVGAALILLVAGIAILYAARSTWMGGWMSLAMKQRQFLVLLWPLALAAGAWQARRELRSNVAELFASTARPQAQRMVPTLGAMGIAAMCAYLAITAVNAPWIAATARYLPAAAFVVVAVGVLALVAAVWLGLAIGRRLPSLLTAPALAVAGLALLLVVPTATRRHEWLTMVLSPMHGMGHYTDYQTVSGRVSAAQAVWLAACGAAAAILFVSATWRTGLAALLPAALGLTAAVLIIPRDREFVAHAIDSAAQQQVCTRDNPRVCVSRVHSELLDDVTPVARQGLSLLARVPGAPTVVEEDTTTFYPDRWPPRRLDTVLIPINVGTDGRLENVDFIIPRMVNGAGANSHGCARVNRSAFRAVSSWLTGRAPTADDPDEPAEVNAEASVLWRKLRDLPEGEAAARVGAFRSAAVACQPVDGVLTGRAR